ncbi:MAG: RnfABCDGE type electron transport complex subunit G, partial [Clostridia bacterium]|nr:RnfABCDGE type electron transport complex subunit G [Clostridia bacterium]
MENSNERKSRRSLPAWAVLTIITLVAAMCLGGTYQMTKDTIAQRTAEEAEATRKALLPDAAAFEEAEASSLDSFYVGKTKEQDDVGYVGVSTVQGFGGEVEVTVGTDADGKITGVRVGGPNFSETAGLGAKTKEPAFYEQFTGKTYPVKLTKDGGEIDAVTSATVTSSAVVRAVNDTVKAMSETAGFHIEEPVSAIEELGNGSYGISGQGVTGAFPIVVNLDGAGAVQSVEVKDSESAMDGSYLSKVQGDPAFLGQFTGKTSVDSSQFDTVSGATVSSNSIIDSVGNVLLYVNDPEAYAAQQTSVPAATPEKTEVSGSNGEYTVSAKGLTGTFDVNVALDGSGAVNAVALGEASSDMDAEYLAKVKGSDTFLAQFVGKSGEIAESDIDTVSGATISSKAVLDAVNTALASAGSSVPVDGTTVTANGLTGTFDVTVALDGSGAVSGVTLGEASSEMDAEYLVKVKGSEPFLAQFVGKSGEIAESGIDTVSGATISSKAVLGAVNTVLASAAPA